ncbi:MAG: redox-sensing transcriptional repressor Rex [Oscillospiraceae bacterium]|nr:redox-sensing transcriptional repressor Rex [Oscillospiraceae bacterium]
MNKQVSKRTLSRLPVYLSLLQEKYREGMEYISATTIANLLGLNHVQVRKDLSCASTSGRPKVGYATDVLIKELQVFLDYNNTKNAVIVGAGDLGKALLGYNGFTSYGLNIVAAFDNNPDLAGTSVKNKPIFAMEKLPRVMENMDVHIGIITTPAHTAQAIADLLVKNGVMAIWNFAPTSLKVPASVIVQNENMATSLAVLSTKLNEKMENDK